MTKISSSWDSYYTNDYSYLFNSVSNNSTQSSSSTSNILGIDLAEYASITRGSYNKLVKAYYQKYGNSSTDATSSADSKSEKIAKTTIKGKANDLYKAADALVTTGKNSLFSKVELKDEETGTVTKDYDKDKIYKAVSSMVDAYNDLVESSTDSTDNAVLRQTLGMINSVSANSSLLSDVGIRIGSDNKLTVDEETFKNSQMSTVKSLFNGSSSLGGKIQSTASKIYLNTGNSLGNSNFYTSTGSLGAYSTGSLMDSLL